MKKILTYVLLLFLVFPAEAQDLNKFKTLESYGNVPADFRKSSAQKYYEDRSKIDKSKSNQVKKSEDKFLLQSNYFLDEVLLSGRVLFGDSVTNYINAVADIILKDDPKLRKKLQFFTLKSSSVNAFSTNQGMVFVTLGLLAQLSSEAELAFILAHEIVHYTENHVIDAYVENQDIIHGEGEYKGLDYDEKIDLMSQYSKEAELEADKKGLLRFLKTNYNLDGVQGAFDVLQYSYLPFDEVPFDKTFFNTKYLIYPETYFIDTVAEISTDEDYDDSKSSHPNTETRREKLDEIIQGKSNSGKQFFILPEKRFKYIRNLARFELSRLYLLAQDYTCSIYNTYLLQKEFPNLEYLDVCMAKALYGLSKYKNDFRLSEVHHDYDDIEGESQRLFYFVYENTKKELNTMVLRQLWDYKEKYPENKYLETLYKDAFKDLVFKLEMEASDYLKEMPKTQSDSLVKTPALKTDSLKKKNVKPSKKKLSKYEKIKNQKEKKKADEETIEKIDFYKLAFIDLFENENFVADFEEIEKDFKAFLKKEKHESTARGIEKKNKENAKYEKMKRSKGRSLGIDKILIADPLYVKLNLNKSEIQYLSSEARAMAFNQNVKKNAELLDLDYDFFDSKFLLSKDAPKLNDMGKLNSWISELFEHDDLEMISLQQDEIQELIDKYGTKYCMSTGVISVKDLPDFGRACLYTYYSSGILLPISLYMIIKPNYETLHYTYVFDLENSRALMVERKFYKAKDRNDILNSNLYDQMWQIKK